MPKVHMVEIARGNLQLGQRLLEVSRCPYCSVASPSLVRVWASEGPCLNADGVKKHYWGAYKCESCASIMTARVVVPSRPIARIDALIPSARSAHEDIPATARTFLQQAYETLHAPDAAAVMAGSAVDAMLKAKGYEHGSLYSRIDQALTDNLLTQGMADWAHTVRLGSNRPRHADSENPHVSTAEAAQAVEFAEALGNFLFVLTARVERGIAAAAPTQS